MFPIRGLIVKKKYQDCWAVFDRMQTKGRNPGEFEEEYQLIAALPPQPVPDPSLISRIFLG
jgi:pentatricopeptide repeat protein